MQVVYICAALYKISPGTPASRGPSSTAGLLVPVAVKTAGTWNREAVELLKEIGRRTTDITGDMKETIPVPAVVCRL